MATGILKSGAYFTYEPGNARVVRPDVISDFASGIISRASKRWVSPSIAILKRS